MENYDLIAAMSQYESVRFDACAVRKLTVKQAHLLMTKFHMILGASRSAERREKILRSCDALQEMIGQLQSGDLDTAIRNADRSTLLYADVELARESVGLVIGESRDPNKAFWLVGQGLQCRVDVSGVLKE